MFHVVEFSFCTRKYATIVAATCLSLLDVCFVRNSDIRRQRSDRPVLKCIHLVDLNDRFREIALRCLKSFRDLVDAGISGGMSAAKTLCIHPIPLEPASATRACLGVVPIVFDATPGRIVLRLAVISGVILISFLFGTGFEAGETNACSVRL